MERDWLLSCFEKELPGEAAHAPYKRYRQQFEKSHAEKQRRPAAVAIHLYLKIRWRKDDGSGSKLNANGKNQCCFRKA